MYICISNRFLCLCVHLSCSCSTFPSMCIFLGFTCTVMQFRGHDVPLGKEEAHFTMHSWELFKVTTVVQQETSATWCPNLHCNFIQGLPSLCCSQSDALQFNSFDGQTSSLCCSFILKPTTLHTSCLSIGKFAFGLLCAPRHTVSIGDQEA